MHLGVDPHPLLDVRAFITELPTALGACPPSAAVAALFGATAPAPLESSDDVRSAIRDLLRHGGYKPTGRGKPSSEYLIRAVAEGALGSINLAVDACNAVSLHSGLPISVVDLGKTNPPLRVAVADKGVSYVFNASGQTIDVGGLLCLFDALGPTANAVKDAQRTKTDGSTTRTLSLLWGSRALPGRAERAMAWYRDLLEAAGARTEQVDVGATSSA